MRFAAVKYEQYTKELQYKFYCASALKCIAENTQRAFGGKAPEKEFYEIIQHEPDKACNADPNEIINRMKNKLSEIGG